MATLCKYENFLPDSSCTLYRVHLSPSNFPKGKICRQFVNWALRKFSMILEYFQNDGPPQRNNQGGTNEPTRLRSVRIPPLVGACKPHLRSVVLLLDISDSMSSKIEDLKIAIRSTVNIILDKRKASLDQIVLITFHSHSKVYHFKDHKSFETLISQLTAGGCSNYASAIDELIKLLKEKQEVIAVMFSGGVPTNESGEVRTDNQYRQSIEKLRRAANNKSLLFHSIGLRVGCAAERILRKLTSIGSTEGFYQSIDSTEITASMNVLVDALNITIEPFVNGVQTHNGFLVCADAEDFVARHRGKKIALQVVTESFRDMLEKNLFDKILGAFCFLLKYHLGSDRAVTFERATAIADHIFCLIRETENVIKSIQQEKITAYSMEKQLKMDSIGTGTGASLLKQQSEIISEYNKQIRKVWKEYSQVLKEIYDLKELYSQILETLHRNLHIRTSISGEIMKVVSQFRDDSIAMKRKHIARYVSKVREDNDEFQNIDQLLQEELDTLLSLESIPVPQYFENYSDPITLNNFNDIMLTKFGIFMLLIKVERHKFGITVPHMTKIIEVSGFSPSVLDVMIARNNDNNDISLLFDYRGIGSGNAAVPLWISELHWRKARHLFRPFVGHAVTCNPLEYIPLQGMTLLALILIHLRQLESTEFNRQLIQMVYQTLDIVIDKVKWQEVANQICNSFDKLNTNIIPSVEVFLVFLEFIDATLSEEKALLLLAEQYRRDNARCIKKFYDRVTVPKKRIQTGDETMRPKKSNKEDYFLKLHDCKLLKWFDQFTEKQCPYLSNLASGLEDYQKRAVVLSSHKCILFKWDAFDEVPAGLSYNNDYPQILLNWCRRIEAEKQQNLIATGHDEAMFLQRLRTNDETEAETFLRNIPRNSQRWGVLLKILLPPFKFEVDDVESYRLQIESLSVPLHFQMIMFCIFNSFNPEDWVSSKMLWRPKPQRRRQIKIIFPMAPEIE